MSAESAMLGSILIYMIIKSKTLGEKFCTYLIVILKINLEKVESQRLVQSCSF